METQRIAWLLKRTPFYWQPVLTEFTILFPKTKIFTGSWPGFALGYSNKFSLEVVGERKIIKFSKFSEGYNPTFTYLSPKIIRCLIQFNPNVIFADGYSLWTVFALALKIWKKWQVVIICDGSSPGVDHRNSKIRLFFRRIMTRLADGFITNNQAGKSYFIEVVGAKEEKVFARPYLIPDIKSLSQPNKDHLFKVRKIHHPIFLFIGQIIPRKGLRELFQACSLLQKKRITDYTVLIVGEGSQRNELENWLDKHSFKDHVKWIGEVNYCHLGIYLQSADILIFPTLEDVWGMVVPEAMTFGKAILCSKWSGAAELIREGENGYIFDPREPSILAQLMSNFIHHPQLAASMGAQSKKIMAQHDPKIVANFFSTVISNIEHKNFGVRT